MNTENISETIVPKAELHDLLFHNEGGVDVLGMIINRIEASKVVAAGTAFDNYDRDPKKRMIVIHPFNHNNEYLEFLIHSKYTMLQGHAEDHTVRFVDTNELAKAQGMALDPKPKYKLMIMPLGPVFHLLFQQHLIKKGLIAAIADGLAYLQSVKAQDGVALAVDAPATVSQEQIDNIAVDIASDFAADRA